MIDNDLEFHLDIAAAILAEVDFDMGEPSCEKRTIQIAQAHAQLATAAAVLKLVEVLSKAPDMETMFKETYGSLPGEAGDQR